MKQNERLYVPLSERMRPTHIDEVLGQSVLAQEKSGYESKAPALQKSRVDSSPIAHNKAAAPQNLHTKKTGALRAMIDSENISSLILWGPPGTGKTTIARLIAKHMADTDFVSISAVSSGIADLKRICDTARKKRNEHIQTYLFIDEIHRFNKSQQDVLLHFVEEGTIILIGATTENPSFEINNALLSRLQVFVLTLLDAQVLKQIFRKAEQMLEHTFDIEESALDTIITLSEGDARRLLNIVEQLHTMQTQYHRRVNTALLKEMDFYTPPQYDKNGEQHYNLVSALHKSIRGSDCDAALYWLARMLTGGENPRYIARRLLRVAYEDIGLADIQAPAYTQQAWETYERLGSPEGEIAIASAVVYLSLAPKSNAIYTAYKAAHRKAKDTQTTPPPKHILNAPTKFMEQQGYGGGYVYDHDTEKGFSGQEYFPEGMQRECFYKPQERGFEREMKKRLEYFNRLRQDK